MDRVVERKRKQRGGGLNQSIVAITTYYVDLFRQAHNGPKCERVSPGIKVMTTHCAASRKVEGN